MAGLFCQKANNAAYFFVRAKNLCRDGATAVPLLAERCNCGLCFRRECPGFFQTLADAFRCGFGFLFTASSKTDKTHTRSTLVRMVLQKVRTIVLTQFNILKAVVGAVAVLVVDDVAAAPQPVAQPGGGWITGASFSRKRFRELQREQQHELRTKQKLKPKQVQPSPQGPIPESTPLYATAGQYKISGGESTWRMTMPAEAGSIALRMGNTRAIVKAYCTYKPQREINREALEDALKAKNKILKKREASLKRMRRLLANQMFDIEDQPEQQSYVFMDWINNDERR